MAFLTVNKKAGIWFSVNLIVFGISFHWCKSCSKLAIEVLNTQFLWDWAKYEEVELSKEQKEMVKNLRIPTAEEMLFMEFDQKMNLNKFFMFTTYEENNPNKIHKWINEEEQVICISFGGAINVIKSETFEDFINSKLKKPENV